MGVHIILQQFRIVVAHFLEVRHHPALVHRVAMESTSELIVNPASRHLFKRSNENIT